MPIPYENGNYTTLIPSAEACAEQRRQALGSNHYDKGDDEQQRNKLILKRAHRRQELETDAAGADEAEHERRADVLVEPIERDPEQRRQDGGDDPWVKTCTRRAPILTPRRRDPALPAHAEAEGRQL